MAAPTGTGTRPYYWGNAIIMSRRAKGPVPAAYGAAPTAEPGRIDPWHSRRYVPPRAPASRRRQSHGKLGRSQVVRQRILIPPFPGSNPGAPASRKRKRQAGLCALRSLIGVVILKRFFGAILNICSRSVRESVRMPLARCGQRALQRLLCVASVGLLRLMAG
jgi:hypothetical protein